MRELIRTPRRNHARMVGQDDDAKSILAELQGLTALAAA
jgi:hypothetical protein